MSYKTIAAEKQNNAIPYNIKANSHSFSETKAKEITKSAPKNENTEKNVLVKFFTSVIAPIIGIPIRITKFMMVRPAVKYFAEVISSIFPAQ